MTVRKQHQTVLQSAARTATVTSEMLNAEQVVKSTFVIDVTAITATPSIVITIDGKDPLSNAFYTIFTSSAITATGTVGASLAATEFLPAQYRVTVTHADTDSITYSVGVNHLVEI